MRVPILLVAALLFGLPPCRPAGAQTVEPAPPTATETQVVNPSPADAPVVAPSPIPAAVAPNTETQPAAETANSDNRPPGLVFPRITVGMVLLYVNLPCALLCLVIAQRKRIGVVRWGLLGLVFGAFALIGVVLDPGKPVVSVVPSKPN